MSSEWLNAALWLMSTTFLLRRYFGSIAQVAYSKSYYFEIEKIMSDMCYFDYYSDVTVFRLNHHHKWKTKSPSITRIPGLTTMFSVPSKFKNSVWNQPQKNTSNTLKTQFRTACDWTFSWRRTQFAYELPKSKKQWRSKSECKNKNREHYANKKVKKACRLTGSTS